ncbi:hypothetical protein [Aeromicrobium sp. UC242_57]|uniref:hypothetical protein n=1 Tax=Aeromicrobium sp. UC242_57 TaxID=3374624 RepID=UPI0037904928
MQDESTTSDSTTGAVDAPASRKPWLQWALVVLALAVAASGLFAWRSAANDDAVALAKTRDTVLMTARQHIVTLNSLDYRKVDEGLKGWAAVTTGTLNDQLAQVDQENRQLLADQKKISVGKVIDAAVTSLDDTTATVIAAVEITVTDDAKPDAEPTVKRNRFSADLVKVKGEWKLENLQQVAVDLS